MSRHPGGLQILTGIVNYSGRSTGRNRNILYKSDFVGENGINIPPISVGSENLEGRACVRLFLRSAVSVSVSEPDTDWNCEL